MIHQENESSHDKVNLWMWTNMITYSLDNLRKFPIEEGKSPLSWFENNELG